MKKRGQISVFIIIGVILLVITAIVFYFQKQQAEYRPKKEVIQKLGPIELYMQSCVDQLGKEAVISMGQTGGYVYLPNVLEKAPSAHIIEDRYGLLKVPFWDFNGQSYMPSITEMEYQIGLYVNSSFKDCLRDFAPLKNEFVFRDLGNYSFKVTIAEEDVAIETRFPLKADAIGRQETYNVETFNTYIPVRLRRVYTLARDIFESENNNMFLENITLQMMTMNSKIPFTGMEFGCKPKVWNLLDVKDEMKKSVSAATQRVRFKNTDYIPFEKPESAYAKFSNLRKDPQTGAITNLPREKAPSDSYDYFHFFISAATDDFKELSADLIYQQDWPMNVNARPSEGVLLKSGSSGAFPGLLSFMCLNTYHFVYDVYHPVEVVIRDSKSFGGEGYNFKFAMPVIIKNNKPTKVPLQAREFTFPGIREGPCNELSTSKIDVIAVDAITNQEIPRVNISYECMRYTCNLGATKADKGVYRLNTGYPVSCPYGMLAASKDLYMDAKVQSPKQGTARIEMVPLKRFNFNLTKVISINLKEAPLLEDETAFITIRNEKYNYEKSIIYPDVSSGAAGARSNITTIDLIDDDATYQLEIMLLKGESYVGGWTGNWTVSSEQMYQKSSVNFIAYEVVPYPNSDDAIIDMVSGLPANSAGYMPRFLS